MVRGTSHGERFKLHMRIGDSNSKGQVLIRKTDVKSTTHAFAKVWVMRCGTCGHEYGSNGCDAHIRKCPRCYEGTAAEGEPL